MNLASSRKVSRDEVPIYQVVEEGLDEIRTTVLEVEIIGVFPHVAGEKRGLALGQRINSVRGRSDLELSPIGDEPRPATAELTYRRRFELLFEFFEAAAITVDRLRNLSARGAAAARFHRVPEEGVIPHLRGVVEHASLRRIPVTRLDQVFERLALHRGAFDKVVEVRDICLMVPAVMEIHRTLGDVRLERVLRVG